MKKTVFLACLITAAFAVSCGGGSGGADSPANVEVLLTDAPAENIESVFVTITKVRIHQSASASGGEAGWRDITITAKMPIDLLTLGGGRTIRLGEQVFPPGHYQQIRLVLAGDGDPGDPSHFIVLKNGEEHPLGMPGDTGLKINRQFTVMPEEKTVILIDFDAEKSVNLTGNGKYSLRPVLSATVTTESPAASLLL